MELNIKQMKYEEAKVISKWIYQEPYSIYSMDGSENCINELLNGSYFSVTGKDNKLIGFYCFGGSARVPAGGQFGVYNDKDMTDIGIGMKPDLCGKGLGLEFLCSGMEFARKKLSAEGFRLTAASFNKRAIKVYEKAGFMKMSSFKRISENGEMEFQVMVLLP